MGEDKAFVKVMGRTLLERALGAARLLTPAVSIVGSGTKFSSYAPVIEDVFRGRGPLGGIHSALAATATDFNLVLAVDLPFVDAGFLRYLIQRAQQSAAMVTVPRAAGGWQPLCAVYRKTFGEFAGAALKTGRNKIDLLFAAAPVLPVEEAEIIAAGFSLDMFKNVNTPEELHNARHSMMHHP